MSVDWKHLPSDALIRLAGGQPAVLQRAPGDRARYTANGAALLSTAGVAVVSATFALTMTMHAQFSAALPFGLGWGLVILVIDRMLILGMMRPKGFTGWLHMGVTVLVRLGMALVIGLVVSTPLVLRVFQPEINSELRVMQNEAASDAQRRIDSDARFVGLPALRQAIAAEQLVVDAGAVASVDNNPDVRRARQGLAYAQVAYARAEQNVVCEKEGTCGSGVRGAGIAFREKIQIRDQARQAFEQAQSTLASALRTATAESLAQSRNTVASAEQELETHKRQLAQLEADKASIETTQVQAINGSDGILGRLHALERIGSHDTVMLLAHIFIGALFVIIELLPVLMKTLQITAPESLYERLVAAQDENKLFAATHAARAQRRIDRMRARVALMSESDLARRRINANKEVNAVVVAKQREVTDRALAAWGEDVSTRTVDEIANWVPSRSTRIVDLA